MSFEIEGHSPVAVVSPFFYEVYHGKNLISSNEKSKHDGFFAVSIDKLDWIQQMSKLPELKASKKLSRQWNENDIYVFIH